MYYSPHTQIALAKARQDDLIREAEQHRLARAVKVERPGIRDWIAGRLHRGRAGQVVPAAQ
jgi:hypothetical protein